MKDWNGLLVFLIDHLPRVQLLHLLDPPPSGLRRGSLGMDLWLCNFRRSDADVIAPRRGDLAWWDILLVLGDRDRGVDGWHRHVSMSAGQVGDLGRSVASWFAACGPIASSVDEGDGLRTKEKFSGCREGGVDQDGVVGVAGVASDLVILGGGEVNGGHGSERLDRRNDRRMSDVCCGGSKLEGVVPGEARVLVRMRSVHVGGVLRRWVGMTVECGRFSRRGRRSRD